MINLEKWDFSPAHTGDRWTSTTGFVFARHAHRQNLSFKYSLSDLVS